MVVRKQRPSQDTGHHGRLAPVAPGTEYRIATIILETAANVLHARGELLVLDASSLRARLNPVRLRMPRVAHGAD